MTRLNFVLCYLLGAWSLPAYRLVIGSDILMRGVVVSTIVTITLLMAYVFMPDRTRK